MGQVPQPVTTTDEFLAAIHDELVGLRADLARATGAETTGVLTEPAAKPAARKRTPPAAKTSR